MLVRRAPGPPAPPDTARWGGETVGMGADGSAAPPDTARLGGETAGAGADGGAALPDTACLGGGDGREGRGQGLLEEGEGDFFPGDGCGVDRNRCKGKQLYIGRGGAVRQYAPERGKKLIQV